MTSFSQFFTQGLKNTLRTVNGVNFAYSGPYIPVYTGTIMDQWFVGDFASASYLVQVEQGSNKKEIMYVTVIARPDQASYNVYGRTSIDDELITFNATVDNSLMTLTVSPTDTSFEGAKLTYLATYGETINPLEPGTPISYIVSNPGPQYTGQGPGEISFEGGSGATSFLGLTDTPLNYTGSAGGFVKVNSSGNALEFVTSVSINSLSDVDTTSTPPVSGQVLKWDGAKWAPGNDVTSGGAAVDAGTLDGFDSSYFLNYDNLNNKPTLATVATSGSYVDLLNKPTISTSFLGLSDTPATFVGSSNLYIRVNSTGTSLEFAAVSGGVLSSRTTVTGTTASLANSATGNLQIASGYKGYFLYKVSVDRAAWVRIYTSQSARSSDSARTQGTDPGFNSGVIAEVITTGSQTIVLSPAVAGFSDETSPSTNIELAVTNLSGSTSSVSVTLTIVKLEE